MLGVHLRNLGEGFRMGTDVLVIGLGYVGLPLAHGASIAGLRVKGFDLSTQITDRLNSGISHIDDITDPDIAAMLSRGFHATSVESELNNPETIVICVPTPLSPEGAPDLKAVREAAATAGRVLRSGSLVVLESTSYPGTTNEIVRPLLEKESGLTAGVDFCLAFSPERIDPGNKAYRLQNTPKVVGGYTTACAQIAAQFYGKLCGSVIMAKSTREAEMAKLLENTYRNVNIALVNEMAIFCHELGIDLWDAIDCAASKPFGFQAFHPGPGVGGHCIPIDPNYLSYKVRLLGYPFRFVELAQEINGRMPAYIVDRAAEILNREAKPLNGSRVILMGVTYKKDIADLRESPVPSVARKFMHRNVRISYHDPYVSSWSVDGENVRRAANLDEELGLADLVVLLQDHSAYDLELIARKSRLVLDTRGRMTGSNVVRL